MKTKREIVEGNIQRTIIEYCDKSIRDLLPSENFVRFARGKKDSLVFGFNPPTEGDKYEFSSYEWVNHSDGSGGGEHNYQTRGIESKIETKLENNQIHASFEMVLWMDMDNTRYIPSIKERYAKTKEILNNKRSKNLFDIIYAWHDAPKAYSDEKISENITKYPLNGCTGQTLIKVADTYSLESANQYPSVIPDRLNEGICNQVKLKYGGNLNKETIKSQIERNLQLADPSYRAAELKKLE